MLLTEMTAPISCRRIFTQTLTAPVLRCGFAGGGAPAKRPCLHGAISSGSPNTKQSHLGEVHDDSVQQTVIHTPDAQSGWLGGGVGSELRLTPSACASHRPSSRSGRPLIWLKPFGPRSGRTVSPCVYRYASQAFAPRCPASFDAVQAISYYTRDECAGALA